MKRKISISIPKPCHENWQEMTPVEKGKFCGSCQKAVYDFTRSSDREIIVKFNSESNICGRFLSNQLNRDLVIPKERNGIWIAGILSFLSIVNQEIFAQEKVKLEQSEKKVSEETFVHNFKTEKKISGTITDNINFLPAVNIINKRTQYQTTSDFNGNFEIIAQKSDEIEFQYLGMENKTVIIDSQEHVTIFMKDSITGEVTAMVGGVFFRKTFFGRIFHSIGNIFR